MTKATSRSRVPTGKPNKYPNLIEEKPDWTGSVDPAKVENALNKLGHLKQTIYTPVFELSKSRDLGLDPSNGGGYFR